MIRIRGIFVVVVLILSCSSSIAQKTEKGNVHILPSVSQILVPDKHNSTSDGGNTTVPGKPHVFPIYDTTHLNSTNGSGQGQEHDNYHHHHHGGHKEKEHNHTGQTSHHGCHHNHTDVERPQNRSCAHDHESDHSAEKVEQILWDIFTDEMDEDSEETNEEVISDELRLNSDEHDPEDEQTEEIAHDETVEKSTSNELNSNEEITSDSHVISKRSPPDSEHKEGRKREKTKSTSRSKSKSKGGPSSVKKYNEYMDVVLKRMNTMIKGKNMDPLMVNLFSGGNKAGDKKKGSSVKNNTKGKKKGGKGKKNNRARMDTDESDEVELDNKHELSGVDFMRKDLQVDEREVEHDGVDSNEDDDTQDGVVFRNVRALILNGSMKRSNVNATEDDAHETRGFESVESGKKSSNGSKSNNKNKNSKKPGKGNSNKPKPPGKKPKQQATRGILKGLSSLRRTGNVDVIRQGDKVRIVRSKFLLGPVMLEIVPKNNNNRTPKAEEGKPSSTSASSSQNSRVTAVASQLKGIIEVRLKKHNPTTIKRLRVFPPSSVKVKSSPKTKGSVPRYSKVTPVATHRLRQIASAVVRLKDFRPHHS
ncbi:unnamed protein product [Orchesella dallaii]|uniref:Uncharacterized protein n=1 Tax=Orchesella dallaii TaxID=48710 RepID=A0ABP1R9X9_9HEXA